VFSHTGVPPGARPGDTPTHLLEAAQRGDRFGERGIGCEPVHKPIGVHGLQAPGTEPYHPVTAQHAPKGP
jgi:hypothetical protein